jgi:beta-glucosidase
MSCQNSPITHPTLDGHIQVDALLAANITPWLTIYHWDHPSALDERYGGWKNRSEMVRDFEAYARRLFERLGDRVKHWITFNEVGHSFLVERGDCVDGRFA